MGTMERTPVHPGVSEFDLQKVLEALVDPVRRSIVTQLDATGEDIACGAFDLSVSKSTATHHFKVLREAGITSTRSIGRNRDVRLRRDDLNARFPGVIDSLIAAIPAPF